MIKKKKHLRHNRKFDAKLLFSWNYLIFSIMYNKDKQIYYEKIMKTLSYIVLYDCFPNRICALGQGLNFH